MTGRRLRLAEALERLESADAAEERHRRQILDLLAADGDPFDRSRHEPGHITASAFVLHPGGEHLLLILHRKLGRWLQPGGHVETGDASVWDAALREIEEETGLGSVEPVGEGPFDVDVHRVAHDGRPHLHFDVRYLVRAGGEPHAGDGVEAVRWAPAGELESMEESLRRPAHKALGADRL